MQMISDETWDDSEEEGICYSSCDDSDSEISMHYASDEEEDYEEWRKRKKKYRESSNSMQLQG